MKEWRRSFSRPALVSSREIHAKFTNYASANLRGDKEKEVIWVQSRMITMKLSLIIHCSKIFHVLNVQKGDLEGNCNFAFLLCLSKYTGLLSGAFIFLYLLSDALQEFRPNVFLRSPIKIC